MPATSPQDSADLEYANLARKHIDFLAGSLGARPSCRAEEAEAARYVTEQLKRIGTTAEIETQVFAGSPTSYGRYALALLITAVSSSAFAFSPSTWTASLLVITGISCALAIMRETDFVGNWTRWIIRSKKSQNVISKIEPGGGSMRDVIVVAHLDTHRTPWFNASRLGQRLFRHTFRTSLILQFLAASCGFSFLITRWELTRWPASFLSASFILIGLLLLQADLTAYSPGAYDNASGVGSALALIERVARQPLSHITLWIACTGCEETGSAGMLALLGHYANTWRDPLILNLDQMGSDQLYIRTCEGFMIRRCVDSSTLATARESARRAGVTLIERESQAYSDGAVAHKFGLPTISLGTQPGDPNRTTHRHRQSDLPEHINREGLIATQRFSQALLRLLDETSGSEG